MKTVKEVSSLTGISIRTLHYYDAIGLLKPSHTTEAGYRLYDEKNLERLQQILLFRELDFPLKDIRSIIDSSDFDKGEALSQQIELLQMKKERIEQLITLAKKIQKGHKTMSFKEFDNNKIDTYAKEAKKRWGHTDAYKEYELKSAAYTPDDQKQFASGLMSVFEEFGAIKNFSPEAAEVQSMVKKLQDYISEHYYTCTNQILSGLGQMYAAGGEMTDNIDKAGGTGTAAFVSKAIAFYCSQN